MGTTIFWQFFTGIPMDEIDTVPLVPFGKWLLPIGVYLLIAGSFQEQRRKNETLVCYRYGSRKRWWRSYFWRGIFGGALLAAFLLLLIVMADMVFFPRGNTVTEIFTAGGLWLIHMTSMLSLFLWLDLQKIRKVVPAVLLLLEGVTFLIGFRMKEIAHAMFGTWGMYVQSSRYDSISGFSIGGIIAAELLIIVAGRLCGRIILTRVEHI